MRPARAAGYSHTRIIFRHMAPNVVAPYLIMLTAFVAQAILAETSLSFLGLGVQEPTAAWGLMLSGNAADFYRQAPWMILFPGVAISIAVFAFNCSATAYVTTSIHASRCSRALSSDIAGSVSRCGAVELWQIGLQNVAKCRATNFF
jgi:ABC-type antimicrobial peptide transport system permease subunit